MLCSRHCTTADTEHGVWLTWRISSCTAVSAVNSKISQILKGTVNPSEGPIFRRVTSPRLPYATLYLMWKWYLMFWVGSRWRVSDLSNSINLRVIIKYNIWIFYCIFIYGTRKRKNPFIHNEEIKLKIRIFYQNKKDQPHMIGVKWTAVILEGFISNSVSFFAVQIIENSYTHSNFFLESL